ncbi:MAG TPA: polysaccharide biosynthesis tyrosine autokinase [Ohtaekwangia sp.]|uniref:GumC family protein n=1 Tax=Ohtaekwangia sp. TaxID=2066019 RepID=UPI002F9514E6
MESVKNNINPNPISTEGIDFSKLRIILFNNLVWIVLIFLVINITAYTIIRYTQDRYESSSEIKLDVKDEASELGINMLAGEQTQSTDLISGEIEMIRSRLFLEQVLDSLDLEVSYFSKGEVLNHELFTNTPVWVNFKIEDPYYFNQPFFLEKESPETFTLVWAEGNKRISGHYGKPVRTEGIELTLTKNKDFVSEGEIEFFFVINSHDVLLSYLISNLSVEPLNYAAKTIRIAFKDYNPAKAQAIVHTIDKTYLHYSYEQKKLTTKQKIDWLNNELTQIELKMEGFEDYFERFTLKNKTNDLQEDLRKTIISINKIDSQRYEVTRRIGEVNKLMDGLQAKNFSVTPSIRQALPEYLFKDIDAVQTLLLQQEKLKLSYNESTLAYREKQHEIDTRAEKTFEQLTELKTDWMKKLQEMNQRKASLESAFVNMPDQNTQYTKNQRFYKLYEEFYLSLMQTKSGFEIAQAGTTPDFKILSPATTPGTPISPNRKIIVGIGFVTSLVAIFFFVGFLYLMHNKITNLQELERISGVPVLGVVPSSRYSASEGLHVISHPKSMVSEAIRTLRTNLDFFRTSGPQKVIAISSTISGEGKSFLALNLGGAMALSRKKVLLIDLDMRKAKTYLPVHVPDPTKGMSTILIKKDSWEDCVLKTNLDFLDYIPSGPIPPNPSELLLNGEFSSLLEDLKKSYDVIILDTPPVGLVTDGIQAMKRADISIYIFRANYSKREFLFNLQRIVSINKIVNVTTLLNALPSSHKKSSGYGYGYYEAEERGNVDKIKSLFKIKA